MENRQLIVGISGASGIIYGIRLLEVLREVGVKTCLIITKAAEEILKYESDLSLKEVRALAACYYENHDLTAPPASGSFCCDGMVIAPCSMKTLAGIASGYAQNLLLRAADVTLKEGRKLVVVPRETPLNMVHIVNMLKLKKCGAVILPAMPAFYHKPKTVDDLVNHVVGKILDVFGLEHSLYKPWKAESYKKLSTSSHDEYGRVK